MASINDLIDFIRKIDFHTRSGRLYFFKIFLFLVFSFFVGQYLVDKTRISYRKTNKIWKLTVFIFITPIIVFVTLTILSEYNLFDKFSSDVLSFGIVGGILSRLMSRPNNGSTIKLIVQILNGETHDVWLDSSNLSVGDVRNRIAETLDIHPPTRILIESGKGYFLEDMTTNFFPLLDESIKATDFFGFTTTSCYISIKEEEPPRRRVSIVDEPLVLGEKNEKMDKRNKFRSLLHNRNEVKYGEPLSLTARIASALPSNNSISFHICAIDKFAAAAPGNNSLQASTIKLWSWAALGDESDGVSISGETNSVTSSSLSSTARKSRGIFKFLRKKKPDDGSMSGKPIHNGDLVVIESGGRFLSVQRGWWMAWSSVEPRRSGSFFIEIIEKAQHHNLRDSIKEKLGRNSHTSQNVPSEADSILRAGDIFCLRSAKFPDYELGITSVKIRDEYCYLGLRKIFSENEADESSWCMAVKFTLKGNTLANVI